MRELVKLEGLSREDWLAYRRRGVGSSDAPIIMGASTWKSPLGLYLEKRGMGDKESHAADLEWLKWGQRLEPVVAEAYSDETGRGLAPATAIVQHDKVDWLLANPDRFITGQAGCGPPPPAKGQGVLECKTASIFKRDEWEQEAPLAYQIQGQHLLAVTGLAWASFAVLIGGNTFRWCDVVRNDRFIKALMTREKEFWERVVNGDPPPAGATEADTRALAQLHPEQMEGKSIVLPLEALRLHEQREQGAALMKEGEALKREAENGLKELLGDAEYGVMEGNRGRYRWKVEPKGEYTVPASRTRVFRHMK